MTNQNDGWGDTGWPKPDDAWVNAVTENGKAILRSIPIDESLEIRYTRYQTVVGIRVGDLFVHEDVLEWGKMIVSHVPTRLKFSKGVPGKSPLVYNSCFDKMEPVDNNNYTKEQLVNWCQRVQQEKRVQWEILSTLPPYDEDMELTSNQAGAMEVIRKHCLGIAVV